MSQNPAPRPPEATPPLQAPVPPDANPKPRRRWLLALGVFVAVLIVAGLAYARRGGGEENVAAEASNKPTPVVSTTKSTPPPTPSPTPTATASPTPAPITPDAIKSFDFATMQLPYIQPGCEHDAREPDAAPPIEKMPTKDTVSCAWVVLTSGESAVTWSESNDPADGGPAVRLLPANTEQQATHAALSATGDLDERWMIGYQDLNGDGYLDAVIATITGPVMQWYVAIFDPDDLQSPYVASLWGSQHESMRVNADGLLTLAGGEGTVCVGGRAQLAGHPPQFSMWQTVDPFAGGCLE